MSEEDIQTVEHANSRLESISLPPERTVISSGTGLRRRGDQYGYNSGSYGATFGPNRMTFACSQRALELGRPTLSYSFREVRVGGEVFVEGSGGSPQPGQENNTIVYRHGSIIERYRIGKTGIEQDFVFTTLPEGRGDITVTGRVFSNLAPPLEGTKGESLTFGIAGHAEVRVSKAIAYDSTGKRTPLELAYAQEEVSITIPGRWVDTATLPITLDPLIGGSIEIDSNNDPSAYGDRRIADIVWNSTSGNWFVVWAEEFGANAPDIFGQHIDSSGNLLGSPIQIGVGSDPDQLPAVAYSSTTDRYLVVWEEWDGGANQSVMGRVVNGDETFFTSVFTIATPNGNVDTDPAVASDGSGWYVVYIQNGGLRGRLVDSLGAPGLQADPDPFSSSYIHPSVDFGDGVYLIAWVNSTTPKTRRMDAVGNFLGNPVTWVGMGGASGSAVRHGDADKFAVMTPNPTANIGQLLNSSGSRYGVLVTTPIETPAIFNPAGITYLSTPNEWFLVYKEQDDVVGRRVSPSLIPIVNRAPVSGPLVLSTGSSNVHSPRTSCNLTTNETLTIYVSGTQAPFKILAQRYGMDELWSPRGFKGLSLQPPQGVSTIDWSWADVSNETGYELHDENHNVVMGAIPPDTTIFQEQFLTENTQYFRHVHAVDAGGLGPPSRTSDEWTRIADPLDTSFNLYVWTSTEVDVYVAPPPNSSSGLTACQIERIPASGGSWTVIKTFDDPGYIARDSGLTAGDEYLYRIRYRNGRGVVTELSPTKSITPPTIPAVPTGLTATPGNNQVSLSWDPVSGATAYIVRRKAVPPETEDFYFETSFLSLVDTDPVNGITYTYDISAYNEGGSSDWSSEVLVTPMAPTSYPALLVVGKTSLSTSDSVIKARLESLGYTLSIIKDSNATTGDANGKAFVFISASVNPGQVNTKFRDVQIPVICCENGIFDDMGMTGTQSSEHGSDKNETELTIVDSTHPLAAGLSGTVTILAPKQTLTWGKPAASAARVATLVSDSSKWVLFGYETDATMSGSPPGTAPARRVGFFLESATAQNLNANGDALFDAAIIWAAGTPAAPSSVNTTSISGTILITWEVIDDAQSYDVLRATSPGGPFTKIATGLKHPSYEDTSIVNGTDYYYTVVASNEGGSGEESAIVQGKGATETLVAGLVGNHHFWALRPPPATFDPNDNRGEYELIVRTRDGSTYSPVDQDLVTTSCTLTHIHSAKGGTPPTMLVSKKPRLQPTDPHIYRVDCMSAVADLEEMFTFHFTVTAFYPTFSEVSRRITIGVGFRTGIAVRVWWLEPTTGTDGQTLRPWGVGSPNNFYHETPGTRSTARSTFLGDLEVKVEPLLKQSAIVIYPIGLNDRTPEPGFTDGEFETFDPNTGKMTPGLRNITTKYRDADPNKVHVFFLKTVLRRGTKPGGATIHDYSSDPLKKVGRVIFVPDGNPINPADLVLTHEFGHAFGLGYYEDLKSPVDIHSNLNNLHQVTGDPNTDIDDPNHPLQWLVMRWAVSLLMPNKQKWFSWGQSNWMRFQAPDHPADMGPE